MREQKCAYKKAKDKSCFIDYKCKFFFLLSFHHSLNKRILGHLKPLLILLTQAKAVSLLGIHLHHTDVNNCTVQMTTNAELMLKFYNFITQII